LNYKEAVKTKRDKRYFDPYLYRGSQYEQISGTISSVNPEELTFTLAEYGGTYQLAGLSNSVATLVAQMNMSIRDAAETKARNAEIFAGMVSPGRGMTVTLPRNIGDAVTDQGFIEAGLTDEEGVSVASRLIDRGDFGTTDSMVGAYSQRGFFQRLAGGLWEGFSHTAGKVTAPAEYLTMFGFSPMMKFMPFRDPLEEYEQMHMYGEDIRLWQKPASHWFAPAWRTLKHNWLGMDATPKHIEMQRGVEEYFDMLKYYKYRMLESEARSRQDEETARHYAGVTRTTVLGGSGFNTENSVASIMGGSEQRYAKAFIHEADPGRQQEILNTIPEFKASLLESQYAHRELRALSGIERLGGLGVRGQERTQELRQLQADEGFERTRRSDRAYGREGQPGESYADYARRQEMEQYFDRNPLPAANWVGFNPAVDLEDVKLKYVNQEGLDYHDFNIYPSRASFAPRKPYITDADVEFANTESQSMGASWSLLRRVNQWAEVPLSRLRYNIHSPYRNMSHVQYDLTQEHAVPLSLLIE